MDNAIILTLTDFTTHNGKTAHGLVRGSERFRILGVIDSVAAGRDAGEVLDGKHRNIPIFATLQAAIAGIPEPIHYCIIGIAVSGGKLPAAMLPILKETLQNGISIVNGLHEFLSDKPAFVRLAKKHHAKLIDVRRPKKATDMEYWSGRIAEVTTPRIAMLGMDCAVGKRTTAKFIVDAARKSGMKAEMIATGQTGWMQEGKYAFILDSTLNDFVSGELETAIVSCFHEAAPDFMILNGQSALRNPMGPCGSELLVSGGAQYAILQAMPSRRYYEGTEDVMPVEIPSVESEIALIRMYGSETIALTLNTHDLSISEARRLQAAYGASLGIPVILPLEDGVEALLEVIKSKIKGSLKILK